MISAQKLFVLSLPVLLLSSPAVALDPTGDVSVDFEEELSTIILDPGGLDVGMPPAFEFGTVSGVDMADVRFQYDGEEDILYIGINTFGIAGDVDGDGDASVTSETLESTGGSDLPDFGGTEGFTVLFDFDEDGIFDIVAGVSNAVDIDGYGLSFFTGNPKTPANASGHGTPLDDFTGNVYFSPSDIAPDLEFSIPNFSLLSNTVGVNVLGTFDVNVYMGSSADEGIGEDFIPKAGVGTEVCLGELDLDGDGFRACDLDCNDEDDSVFPEAEEFCDAQDNDCDGISDEGFDTDEDGIGDCLDEEECDELDNDGDGQIDEALDADNDGLSDCDPEEREVCDEVDNDGDGIIDEGDADLDGIPDCDPSEFEECDALDNDGDGISDEGFDADGNGIGDCLDDEFCDGFDNDGDGQVDEGFDVDDDGIKDCDDQETCDALDNDGDGLSDEDFDSDGDGIGDCLDSETCDSLDNDGDGRIDEDLDPDGDGQNNCGDEVCDDFDNDGDGQIDENFDSDRDGISDCFDVEECDGFDNDGDGKVDEGDANNNSISDCLEQNISETCNGIDDDFDGEIDEGLEDSPSAECRDTDRDGLPDATDNCPEIANPGQEDSDGDGRGDECPGLESDAYAGVRIHGNGCDTGGTSGSALGLLLLAMGVVSLRLRKAPLPSPVKVLFLLSFGALLTPSLSLAQEAVSLSTQQFTPAAGGPGSYLRLYGTQISEAKSPAFSAYLNYGHRPLSATYQDGETVDLIRGQTQLDLMGTMGIIEELDISVGLPVTLYQSGEQSPWFTSPELATTTLGDIRIVPKYTVLTTENGPGLALLGILTLPTGNEESYQGNPSVSFEPRAVLELGFAQKLWTTLNFGYVLRKQAVAYNLEFQNELTYGLGFRYAAKVDTLDLIAEVAGKLALGPNSTLTPESSPLEASLAARYALSEEHFLTFGAGPGLAEGYGTPVFRAFAGYAYNKVPEPEDSDFDGIIDINDQCPDAGEDFDGFQDEDGCPEFDDDGDGIADAKDECQFEAEDLDGFQDEDGCPDDDNDADGIADTADQCPLQPEDMDGFQDEDGCIDPDNDDDGLVDQRDKCPEQQEDFDGYEDTDGCPEAGAAEAVSVTVTETSIEINEAILFETGRAEILPISYPLLLQIGSVLQTHEKITLLSIEGHADYVGSPVANLELSKARAGSIRSFLIEQSQVDGARLEVRGYGATRPIADNSTALGRAKNRRVEFIILQMDGEMVQERPAEPTVSADGQVK